MYILRHVTFFSLLAALASLAAAQESTGAPGEFLRQQPSITELTARVKCPVFPAADPQQRILGPHGDRLIDSRCEVIEYKALGIGTQLWFAGRYKWTSIFTAEDQRRGHDARDTAIEEEVVLFERQSGGMLRPVWHSRFEADAYGAWRSVTPEISRMPDARFS